jgi:outer membrane protein assembly factor BamB
MRLACFAALTAIIAAAPASAQSVTTYHNGISRHGDYVVPSLTFPAAATMHLDPSFSATLAGNVYAQPLFWQSTSIPKGEIIIATESNVVAALNPDTGALLWQKTLGTPVPLSDLPCGNIDPEGITGTPAIDRSTGQIYLDALIDTANGPRQQIFALNAATGAIAPNYPIDVQSALAAQNITFDSTVQGERSAALFLNGRLFLTYAGRAGDCGDYHGTILQVETATAKIDGFWATRATGGGIWAQGGAFSNGTRIFATTGNTFGATEWSDGEAILRLAPGLDHSTNPADFFTPGNWKILDNDDADLGGTDATLLTVPVKDGTVPRLLALGKDGNAYLVNGESLGGINGQLATLSVSTGPIITAAVVYQGPAQTLVAFQNRGDPKCGPAITMLRVYASTLKTVWCQALNGMGAPILTTTDGVHNPIVWVAGANGDELLHGYDGYTGAVLFDGGGSANAMFGVRSFATILAAHDRFYVAGATRLYAFRW